MDSISQIALGAAVGVATMGRRTAVWKAALWGGVCGTLPDLDAFVDFGDPIRNMTLHRGDSHALLWLSLAAPPIAAGIARLNGEWDRVGRWWLAVWLVLVTHPLLDVMTIYGTQLLRPFTDHPYGVGSIFIIDPIYTLSLLVGVAAALRLGHAGGLRWNTAGLVLSTAYLAWSAAAQQHVSTVARASLQAQGLAAEKVLATPTAFNTVLWRIVAIDGDTYREGFYSLLDGARADNNVDRQIRFDTFPRGIALYESLSGSWPVQRIAWFSHGFFRMTEQGDGVVRIADLRMGQEPHYFFDFTVARRQSPTLGPIDPQRVGGRPDIERGLRWLWRRALGEALPPPR
jgi:inner membrane protein